MELRTIFTRDILTDHELVAIMAYCICELQPIPRSVRYNEKVFELKPYEVFIDYKRVGFELNISKDIFEEKVDILRSLNRIKLNLNQDYCRVEFLQFRYPITSPDEIKQPGEDIIPIKLKDWIEIDLVEIKRKKFSKKYMEMVRQVLNRSLKVIGDKYLTEITISDYEDFVDFQRERETGNCSINNYRRVLNSCFNRAIALGYLKSNIFKNIKTLPVIRAEPKIVERDEIEILLKNIEEQWLSNVIKFAFLSTKRHGEILNLKWSDIDWRKNRIFIHSSETYRVKFGKEQYLPISNGMAEILRGIEKQQMESELNTDLVFTNEKGNRLRLKVVQETLMAYRHSLGLGEHVTIHGLRRTAATILKEKGITTNTIRGLLNHTEEGTTNRYLGVPKDDELKALNSINLIDFLPKR